MANWLTQAPLVTLGLARPGSWFGAPELGLTERAAGTLSGGKTTDLSSAITRNYAQSPESGQTLGATNQPNQSFPIASNPGTVPPGSATSTVPSGGGTGDSRFTQLEKIETRNPVEEDEYQRLLREMQGGATNQAQIELEQTLSEYDKQAEGLQSQSGQLDAQRQSALGTLSGKQTEAVNEAGRAKQEAKDTTQTAQRKLLSTAQDVQRSNRNVLRALGILSSSAAGEMLNKPINEFQTQAGELQQGLVKRIGVVEDWLMSRQNEFANATKELETQYASLKENISRDLRFNSRDRVAAVKAAGAALQQRMQEIEQQSLQYAQAAKQYSDNILMKIAEMQMYQNPQADTSSIMNTLLSGAQGAQRPVTAAVTQSDEQRRRLSGLA